MRWALGLLLVVTVVITGGELAARMHARAQLEKLRAFDRGTQMYQPSPVPGLGAGLIPNLDITIRGVRYHMNAHGWRGPALEVPKRRTRVMLVGNTVLFGSYVDEAVTVAGRLRALRPDLEIINASTQIYDVTHMRVLVTNVLADYAPDQIVLGVTATDGNIVSRVSFDETGDVIREQDLRVRWFPAVYARSDLYRRLYDTGYRLKARAAGVPTEADAMTGDTLSRYSSELEALIAGSPAPLLLVAFPTRGQAGRRERAQPAVEALARRRGIAVLDMSDALSAESFLAGRGPKLLNASGHALVAERLERHLGRRRHHAR